MQQEQRNQTPQSSKAQTVKWFNFHPKTGNEIEDDEAMRIICEMKADPGSHGKTKAVWFDIDLIDEIYNYLHANNNDGIRIYFGKYPNKERYRKVPSRKKPDNDYRGKHTLIIVPTYPNAEGTSDDDLDWKDCKDLPDVKDEKAFLAAYNHGELCPPLTGCRS